MVEVEDSGGMRSGRAEGVVWSVVESLLRYNGLRIPYALSRSIFCFLVFLDCSGVGMRRDVVDVVDVTVQL